MKNSDSIVSNNVVKTTYELEKVDSGNNLNDY